jgi:hypothetical protein
MPVTFGTVQLVPAQSAPPAPAGAQAAPAAPPPPDARDLGLALRHLQERAARVRAH